MEKRRFKKVAHAETSTNPNGTFDLVFRNYGDHQQQITIELEDYFIPYLVEKLMEVAAERVKRAKELMADSQIAIDAHLEKKP